MSTARTRSKKGKNMEQPDPPELESGTEVKAVKSDNGGDLPSDVETAGAVHQKTPKTRTLYTIKTYSVYHNSGHKVKRLDSRPFKWQSMLNQHCCFDSVSVCVCVRVSVLWLLMFNGLSHPHVSVREITCYSTCFRDCESVVSIGIQHAPTCLVEINDQTGSTIPI